MDLNMDLDSNVTMDWIGLDFGLNYFLGYGFALGFKNLNGFGPGFGFYFQWIWIHGCIFFPKSQFRALTF